MFRPGQSRLNAMVPQALKDRSYPVLSMKEGNFLSYEVADTFEIGFAPRRQRANGL